MTKINSKSKGNRFEREICKFFQEWSGYEFSRVPASGGLRWKKADNIASDVICTDPKHGRRFPVNVECKSYEELKFEHILLGNKTCKILNFWDQAVGDANRAKKIPVLIMKYNNMPKGEYFFMVSKELWDTWVKEDDNLNFTKPKMAIEMNTGGLVFYILMASDIKQQNYTGFYKAARKLQKKIYKD